MQLLTIEDIRKAKRRIDPYIHHTPIFTSQLLNSWLGHEIYFKAESLQKVGAFKVRGGCNTVSWLIENDMKTTRIVANSSGNHAQAVAWAASQFGIPSTIFMPKTASSVKIQATKAYGAEIVLCETRAQTDEWVEEASKEEGTYWIPPFNHEQVISGQGTAVFEAISEIGEIDAVFAPCGGGGLASGSLVATRGLLSQAKVIGAEPLAGNDAAQSVRTGKIVRLPDQPKTLADGAMTLAVGDITFEYLKKLDDILEIDEEPMVYWSQWLSHLLKLRVEPTSAMAMEAASQWLKHQQGKKKVVIVLTGGNIDQAKMAKIWENNYLDHQPTL